MKLITPAEAYWRQRHRISEIKERLRMMSNIIGFENDLNLYQWAQIGSFVLEYKPDLILELGRKHGNSTCLFSEIVNKWDLKSQIISICWSKDFEEITVPKLKEDEIINDKWIENIICFTRDITSFNYKDTINRYKRILVFWDAHGFEVASCVLGAILPVLEKKEHYVLIHDLSDQRFMSEELSRYNGQKLWHGDSHSGERMILGHINSAVAQAISIYDFCSRNHIWLESADYTFHEFFSDTKKLEEMKNILGDHFFSMQGHWFYLSLNEHSGPFTYPVAL